MRKETFGKDVIVHVVQRGARQANIVRDESDRWRFLRLIKYLNDDSVPRNWEREIAPEHIRAGFKRPETWGEPAPYVSILAYCLMDNHFHILLQERTEDGIAKFMQRVCTSMAAYFNTKYKERGSLFQGPYRARVVDSDVHLQYLAAYIQIKNPFERYPHGFQNAIQNYKQALEWAQSDPFNSLADYLRLRQRSLVDFEAIDEIFGEEDLITFGRDLLEGKYLRGEDFHELELD